MAASSTEIIGRRYILRQPLGKGGMGAVYLAHDRLTGQPVALKRVLPMDEQHTDTPSTGNSQDFRLALAQEFKVLASLRHPHIISVIDYGFDDQRHPYFTMELLENAQTILEAGEDRPIAEQVNLLVQMLQALAYLHRRGIIHRDLKPRNVLVLNGQVKVLDFGLSLAGGHGEENTGSTAGTLAYMAPEVMMGQPASEAADLYAVGMMAYELFAGKHPFDSDDLMAMLNNSLYKSADMDSLDVDYGLIVVLEKLLAKSRESRYQDAADVIRELSEAAGQPVPQETEATRESFLQAARLVGRIREIQQLTDALTATLQGKGSAWLIGGESGVGKSRLVDEIRAMAMTRGALVLRGQGISEGGSPFLLWRAALRWLCLLVDLEDEQFAVLKALVPDVGTLLGRDIPDAPELPPKAAQTRLLNTIELLFRRQQQPIVMMLEDLHWANESLDVLARLNQIVGDLPLLIIGSFRDDERPELPAQLPNMTLVKLERLNQHEIAELSEAMLGESGKREPVVDLLQRETEGNVLFLVEVVRYLAEEAGQLDRIGLATLPAQLFVGGVQKVIQRRLRYLPSESLPLLRFAAVMGRQLDLDVLRAAEPGVNFDRWLTTCSDAAVLDVLDDKWRFAHDKLREAILSALNPDEIKALHNRAGATLERLHANNPEQAPLLAYHYGKAGNGAKEEIFAALAGAGALTTGAYRDALHYLVRALELARGDSHDIRLRQVKIRQQMASAHLGLGEYGAAESLYGENLAVVLELQYFKGIGDTFNHLGDVAAALSQYDEATRLYHEGLAIYQDLDDQEGMMRALNNLGSVAYETGDLDKARRLYQESLSLSRESGSQWGMAGAIGGGREKSEHAPGGDYASVEQAFNNALMDYQSKHVRQPMIEAFQRLASATTTDEDYVRTRHACQDAAALFQGKGDRWGTALALEYAGAAAFSMADYTLARQYLRPALNVAYEARETTLVLDILVAIGRLLAALKQPELGLQLFSMALHHPDSTDKTQDEAERLLFELEDKLDAKLVSTNWEKGKTRPFDATVRELLDGTVLNSP